MKEPPINAVKSAAIVFTLCDRVSEILSDKMGFSIEDHQITGHDAAAKEIILLFAEIIEGPTQ